MNIRVTFHFIFIPELHSTLWIPGTFHFMHRPKLHSTLWILQRYIPLYGCPSSGRNPLTGSACLIWHTPIFHSMMRRQYWCTPQHSAVMGPVCMLTSVCACPSFRGAPPWFNRALKLHSACRFDLKLCFWALRFILSNVQMKHLRPTCKFLWLLNYIKYSPVRQYRWEANPI